MSSEDIPLVPSEGVGSGGKDHSTKHLMFRLPPPIPGKPGGGYPPEYHTAATTIQRNVKISWKRRRPQGMKEAALDSSDQLKSTFVGERVRKRDMLMNYVKGARLLVVSRSLCTGATSFGYAATDSCKVNGAPSVHARPKGVL